MIELIRQFRESNPVDINHMDGEYPIADILAKLSTDMLCHKHYSEYFCHER